MSEKKTCYIVTSGAYSSYGICAVFDSRELAEAMMVGKDTDGFDGYQIEEFTVNPGEDRYREGQRKWVVEMRQDGSVSRVDDLGWAWIDVDVDGPLVRAELRWETGGPSVVVGWLLRRELWAKSEEQAVKSTNELRAQWIADGSWDTKVAKVREQFKHYTFSPGS